MVDFDDVHALIRQACCVLNPSLYEGWSTTVEETKTIGKPMVLSDLEVHREQDPPATLYFEPKNAAMLAEAMVKAWDLYPAGPNREMEQRAAEKYAGLCPGVRRYLPRSRGVAGRGRRRLSGPNKGKLPSARLR